MTAANFPAALAFTLAQEGGWSDNPNDPGGCTNKGITLHTMQLCGMGDTPDDLRNITDEQVATIYRDGYWDAVHADTLLSGIDLSVFDFGVNNGPRVSIEILQLAVGVSDDGIIGPVTLAAVAKASPSATVAALAGLQKAHYLDLIEGNPRLAEFRDGWLARNERRAIAALKLISKGTPP